MIISTTLKEVLASKNRQATNNEQDDIQTVKETRKVQDKHFAQVKKPPISERISMNMFNVNMRIELFRSLNSSFVRDNPRGSNGERRRGVTSW